MRVIYFPTVLDDDYSTNYWERKIFARIILIRH